MDLWCGALSAGGNALSCIPVTAEWLTTRTRAERLEDADAVDGVQEERRTQRLQLFSRRTIRTWPGLRIALCGPVSMRMAVKWRYRKLTGQTELNSCPTGIACSGRLCGSLFQTCQTGRPGSRCIVQYCPLVRLAFIAQKQRPDRVRRTLMRSRYNPHMADDPRNYPAVQMIADACPSCFGAGRTAFGPCPTCQGSGKAPAGTGGVLPDPHAANRIAEAWGVAARSATNRPAVDGAQYAEFANSMSTAWASQLIPPDAGAEASRSMVLTLGKVSDEDRVLRRMLPANPEKPGVSVFAYLGLLCQLSQFRGQFIMLPRRRPVHRPRPSRLSFAEVVRTAARATAWALNTLRKQWPDQWHARSETLQRVVRNAATPRKPDPETPRAARLYTRRLAKLIATEPHDPGTCALSREQYEAQLRGQVWQSLYPQFIAGYAALTGEEKQDAEHKLRKKVKAHLSRKR